MRYMFSCVLPIYVLKHQMRAKTKLRGRKLFISRNSKPKRHSLKGEGDKRDRRMLPRISSSEWLRTG